MDLAECLDIAAQGKVTCTVQERKLEEVNEVLEEMAAGKIKGRVVFRIADE